MSFEIGKVLDTEESFSLDIKSVIASRTYIASETRMGKSWTTRKIVEEVYGHIPIIIIDPEGEYASLREKYSFVIIGRDVPLEVETAEFMAEWILKENVSVIIDTSMVKDDKDYIDRFLNHFFYLETTARKPYLLIVEEAEDYGAEKGAPGVFLPITAVLGRKGGKRGIGVIYVGHRPAWISKGILSQCPNKAIGKIESTDFRALEDFARIPHEIVEKLPSLDKGEFCLAGDWVNQTTFVKVGQVKTTHLGATPDIIPSTPKELESVIEGLKKRLPEVIEKAKATVTPIAEIRSKIENELKSKYEGRIETLQKTAEERAERKWKAKVEQQKDEIEKLSRAQALQPTAPITDVLEHPIVRARMLQLDDKARDLLTWIEREPGHTREELAARMVASKDTVADMVQKVNRVFQLEVIVDDGGRPLRYNSMLKRLFLTDVAKREIEELERLQVHAKALENELITLRPIAQQSATWRGEVEHARKVNKELADNLEKRDLEMKELKERNEALAKENEAYRKIKEGFQALGITAPSIDIEKRLERMKQEILDFFKTEPVHIENVEVAVEVEKKVEELVEKKIAEKGAQLIAQKQVIDLEHKELVVDVHHAGEEHVQMNTTTDKGKILYCAKEDLSKDADGKPKDSFTWSELKQAIAENGWVISDPTLSARLTDLAREGRLIKLEKGGYRLPSKVRFEIEKDCL